MSSASSSASGKDATPMSDEEFARMVKLEAIIERGVEAYKAVGDALLEIRDRQLYRATHGTFDAYCKERWKFSRFRGYQLIQASVVAAQVSGGLLTSGQQIPAPANEKQARALAAGPEELRAPVWHAAVDLSGGQPPTSRIREIMEKARAGVPAEKLAAAVRESEAKLKAHGDLLSMAADKEDADWRVGRARWHLRRARRLLETAGEKCQGALPHIDLADETVVRDYGSIPLRD